MFERFGAQWTPTILVLDRDGVERHRFEGFLPADEFLAQLQLGLGHVALARRRFDEAEKLYREVVEKWPETDAAPAALYWAGVARYKASNDAAALSETAAQFRQRYADSVWAKKAAVWGSEAA